MPNTIKSKITILGISAFFHDSAAAITQNGRIIAAAQEERFTRNKHDSDFPLNAIGYCLEKTGITIQDVDLVVFYEQPLEKFKRLLKTYFAFAPAGFQSYMTAIPLWLSGKLYQKRFISAQLKTLGNFDAGRLAFTDHHLSHAASAFYASPYREASILVIDGVGENATTTIAHGSDSSIVIKQQINFPHSLGMLYSAFTYYLGFKVNSGEYKVMGLAPYGQPIYAERILEKLVSLKSDGSFRLDQQYFDYCTGLAMTNSHFDDLFDGPRRESESDLTQKHFDIAASIQSVTEQIVLSITRYMGDNDTTGNLCMAGGVALNCVANGKVLRDGKFNNIWVQPAAGDAGNAIGAALIGHHQFKQQPRHLTTNGDIMSGSYLGPEFSQTDCERRLKQMSAVYTVYDDDTLFDLVANALASDNIVGWFQGRMEFGPRALGNRSILADPRSERMQKELNLKVKYRESFRPFAPSVLAEDAADWFDLDSDSPYMQLVAPVSEQIKLTVSNEQQALFGLEKLSVPHSSIPAVTHVDYSARIQTVHRDTNPRYHQLISAFNAISGCPVLVNTSFNVRGEPIVCTPEDAFSCFMDTDMDYLAIGNCLMVKSEQTIAVSNNSRKFAPD